MQRICWIKMSLSHLLSCSCILLHFDDLYRSATVSVHYHRRLRLIDIQTWQSEMLTSLARDYTSYQGNGAATVSHYCCRTASPGLFASFSAEAPSAHHINNKLCVARYFLNKKFPSIIKPKNMSNNHSFFNSSVFLPNGITIFIVFFALFGLKM